MTHRRTAVSVVMPVHNGGRDLGEALESMLGQTFGDFELIAVDDHSTDDTPVLLRQAAKEDSRVRVIASPERGFVAAVSAGIAASGSEWIARMDADDRSHPERLTRQMTHLAAHPDLDMLGTAVRVIDARGERVSTIRYPLDHALIALSLRAATAFAHGTVVMRRGVLTAAGGYRPERFPVEDYDLWCRLVVTGAQLANLDEPLYDYRLSAGGVSRTDQDRQETMAGEVGIEYGHRLSAIPTIREASRGASTTIRMVRSGDADARALARASRSSRESILPWLQSRRWAAANAAGFAALRTGIAYRRLSIAGGGRPR